MLCDYLSVTPQITSISPKVLLGVVITHRIVLFLDDPFFESQLLPSEVVVMKIC